MLLSFLVGVTAWTLTEYLLHRFLGHVHRGKNFFKAEHVLHHSRANYFAPAYKKALLALPVTAALLGLLCLFLPVGAALAFIMGFTGMYGLYEVTHFRFHSTGPVAMPFIVLRKHHFYHHFHNPKMNHGVTTRFWDRVFGTYKPVEQVRVPYQMAMPWLLNGTDINHLYSPHFTLAGHRHATHTG